MKKEARTGFILSAIVCAIGIYGQVYVHTKIPEDGQSYASVVFWLLTFLGVLLAVETILKYRKAVKTNAITPAPEVDPAPVKEKFDWFGPVGILILAILFVIGIRRLDDLVNLIWVPLFHVKIKSGMFIAIPIFLIVAMKYFKMSWKTTIIVTVIATVVIYLMFVVLLKVYMP